WPFRVPLSMLVRYGYPPAAHSGERTHPSGGRPPGHHPPAKPTPRPTPGRNQSPPGTPHPTDPPTQHPRTTDPAGQAPTPPQPPAARPRPGSAKRQTTAHLPTPQTQLCPPPVLPSGARFQQFQDYVVQDLVLRPHNTCYRQECWRTPEGTTVRGQLPAGVREGGHFGPTLKAFLLDQYYRQRVTQPRLLNQVRSWGVDLSAGQLNRLLTQGHERFHQDKDALLPVGLTACAYIQVDDTAARHRGQ